MQESLEHVHGSASDDAATPPTTPRKGSERFFRLLPAMDSLRHYSLGNFRSDSLAGLTVAAVAVPQAMAYATIFGVPVEYGLYTAMVTTVVGALFDPSR